MKRRCRKCTKTALCAKCRKRASREANPIRTLFMDHLGNARRRKKVVSWGFDEFKAWCEETGHHLLVKDGYQIHRLQDSGPYSSDNCVSIPGVENKRLEAGYAWKRKWLAHRYNFLQTLNPPTIFSVTTAGQKQQPKGK